MAKFIPTPKKSSSGFVPTPRPADKPVTMRVVKAIVADASTAAAPIPFPVVWPIFISLIQALFPCLVAPSPATLQRVMSNPNRFQHRRMDIALHREYVNAGEPGGNYLAFSHATFGQCRKASVQTWAGIMRENPAK